MTDNASKPTRPLAMASVRRQKWRNIYRHELAFPKGTIFADLDKPWNPSEARILRQSGGNAK
ncbi:MAG: spore coat associated protein CotJA [Oscillospiraceae bacterium]|nr:spore coat associated protein CotJA [Oscillospiraceae bacterium]